MFTLASVVALLVFAIVVLFVKDFSKPAKIALTVLPIIFAIALIAISCCVSVPVGHTGILTTFGKVESAHLDSGLHIKKPWQKIVTLDNRMQVLKLSANNATPEPDSIETRDQQLILEYEFEIYYQLNPEESYKVYSTYGESYEDKLIASNCRQFIKEVFASYCADEIVTAKEKIPMEIVSRLSAVTVPLGINIERINFISYDFSPEYTAVLEQRALLNAQIENNQLSQKNETIAAQTQYDVAVKQAEKEAETQRIAAENENQIAISKATAKAETDRINAENKAYVTRTTAEAEKDARMYAAEATKAELEAKSSGLNDYVIQQEWISKWDGKLIPSFDNSGVGFTNYTDIISKYLFSDSGEAGDSATTPKN